MTDPAPRTLLEINPPPRPKGLHKRLRFTAQQWAVLVAQASVPLHGWLRPTRKDIDDDTRERTLDELRQAGVLGPGTDAPPVPSVERSLQLLATAPVVVTVAVASAHLSRESVWAMDAAQLVAVFRRADGGVEWLVAAAPDAGRLLSESVPQVEELVSQTPTTRSGIAAALGTAVPSRERASLSLPLALLQPSDPLTSEHPGQEAAWSQTDVDAASSFLRAVRGTVTARVQALSWTGQHPAPAAGHLTWFATAEGWWATSAEPGQRQRAEPAQKRIRLTPTSPDRFASSLAPMLTTAFGELAAASWRSTAAGAQHEQHVPGAEVRTPGVHS